jgi:dynein light chain LC8-type
MSKELAFRLKSADMGPDMQEMAEDTARAALRVLKDDSLETDLAKFIKVEFDKKFGPTWHCIVGRNFGSFVTHESTNFIYFYLGDLAFCLFKAG